MGTAIHGAFAAVLLAVGLPLACAQGTGGDPAVVLVRQTETYLAQMKAVHAAIAAADFRHFPDLPDWPANLPSLAGMLDAEEEDQRWDVLAEIASVAADPACPGETRRVLVGILAAALDDTSVRIARSAAMWLLRFDASAFSVTAREAVFDNFRSSSEKNVILVVGKLHPDARVAERIAAMADSSQLLSGAALFASPAWASLLASARSGDGQSIQRVIDAVAAESDSVLQVSRLLHEITYVRQPRIAGFLREFLFSDERLPSSKSTARGILVAQHAAAALADMLEDFPVAKEYARYTDEDLRVCRDWMTRTGDNWRFRT